MCARIKAHKQRIDMIQLSAQSGLELHNAWVNGLDYVEAEGYTFGMFADGIWVIHSDTVFMDDTSKVQFMGLPSVAWGSNS